MKNFTRFTLPLAALCAIGTQAHAQVVGAPLIVDQTGDVTISFVGSTASYSDDLYLDSPANGLGLLFNNHASVPGSTIDLGSYPAGTELIFRLHVNNTGDDFFTGPGSRNPDGQPHDRVTSNYTPTSTLVEFEDLYNGPFEYNDLSFAFTNIAQVSAVPEPGSVALLVGMGTVGVGILRKRRNR